jgi:hypothetical protein
MKNQFDLAKQATHDRVETAREGKRLVDEGGEPTVQLLLARRASIDAAAIDKRVAEHLQATIAALDDSGSRLKTVNSLEASHEMGFSQLADDHFARCASLRQISNMLGTGVRCAEMDAAQQDALNLVKARTAYSKLLERTNESLENIKEKANIRPNGDSERSSMTPITLEGLQDKTHSGLQAARQAANDRLETAKGGKKLLDEGGDSKALTILAKKGSMDAVALDKFLAQQVQTATYLFEESSSLLKKAEFEQSDECKSGQVDLADLAREHDERAQLYRQIRKMLEVPIDSSELTLEERDALILVRIKEGTTTLKDKTFEGFENIKAMALAGCAA